MECTHSRMCHVGLASICHFLVLGPHLMAISPYLWLSTNRIARFHWILDLRHSSKGHGPDLWLSTNRIVGPSSKVRGSNLWLLNNRIALFHWTLDLRLHLKAMGSIYSSQPIG
jgi:hypothetical protein